MLSPPFSSITLSRECADPLTVIIIVLDVLPLQERFHVDQLWEALVSNKIKCSPER